VVHSSDPSHGKQLFQDPKNQCSGCHTLADAGTKGTIGPNLDDAFSSAKAQGFSLSSMIDLVRGQIAYPEKPMPANLLTGQDASDVAAYIAKCAGNPHCGVTPTKAAPAQTTTGGATTSAAPDGKALFQANCALKPSASRVALQVKNGGAVMPSFASKLTPTQIQAIAQYVASVAGK
jgi:mono/diheme cytochrome c family protein